MYHRVAQDETDPWELCVSAAHFAEQLQVLARMATLLPLARLAVDVERGRIRRGSVAITFDDGYRDNLLRAAPLLARADAPATVFVVTGGEASEREFWWDELDRLLLQPGRLPASLELTVAGASRRWELGDAATYSVADATRDRGWTADEPPPTMRQAMYLDLWKALYDTSDTERQRVLGVLRAWGGLPPAGRASRQRMTPEEVADLPRSAPIELGAHTVTHSPLPSLDDAHLAVELGRSKRRLEELTGVPVTAFAYPHGAHDPRSVAAVRRAGFTCACTTVAAPLAPSSAVLELPRVHVRDWEGEAFERRLAGWLGA
jgi:peptidoglycan/xylan/chitin deacetylase (PgdA/CDA1 family)